MSLLFDDMFSKYFYTFGAIIGAIIRAGAIIETNTICQKFKVAGRHVGHA